jgi:hypothetical protein
VRLPGRTELDLVEVVMRGLLRSTLTQNAKYLAVSLGVFAFAGGTATTVTLSSHGSPSPSPRSSHAAVEAQDEAQDAADGQDATDQGDTGVRPTDTHGYCVSHAVAAAKAAHKTGQDIAAAAHSCPNPGHKPGNAKHGNHGKSATAPGRAHSH